jgi:hypothetical protein
MRSRTLICVVSSLAFVLSACSSSRTKSDAQGSDGADGAESTDGADGETDVVGSDGVDESDGGAKDVLSPLDVGDSQGSPDVVDEEDAALPPGSPCGTFIDGGLPVGMPCTAHEECSTGYCYDEELWNEDGNIVNRFCTAKCAGCTEVGNCNEWPKADGAGENKCYPLTTSFINKHSLTLTSLCMPTCGSSSDCADIAPYTVCRLARFDGNCSYGVTKICQPEDFSGNEACE